MKKRVCMLVLAVLMVLSCASCKLMVKDEQKDLEQVVARVNGVEITKADVMAAYHTYRYYYRLTDENEETEQYISSRNTLLENAYSTLIEYQLIKQYAAELTSVELTPEMEQSIADEKAQTISAIESGAETVAADLAKKDPGMDQEAACKKRIEDRLVYRGISTGEFEKTRAWELVIDAVRTALSADYEPTDKAIQNYYDTYLDIQKSYMERDLSYYDYYTSESVNLYMPAGFRYVKNLLIAIPDSVREEIASLRADGKDAEADALRDQELSKIAAKAQEIYARIQNGESYDELLAAYGDDPGMKAGAENAETGYRIYDGSKSYEDNFKEAAMGLANVGDVSQPVGSDYGYYIIRYVGDSVEQEIPVEQVRDQIRAILVKEKATEYYEEIYENWKRQATIEEYKDRIY